MVKIKNCIATTLMNDVYFVMIAICFGAIIGTTTILLFVG